MKLVKLKSGLVIIVQNDSNIKIEESLLSIMTTKRNKKKKLVFPICDVDEIIEK